MRAKRLARGCLAISLALSLLLGTAAATAADPSPPSEKSDFKGMLGELWAKLRAVSPRSRPTQTATNTTMTAGVRGSEATESELKPYWKGEPSQAERSALLAAQGLADGGKLDDAARAFDVFLEAYPRSPLASEARFGGALARAALGDKARAIAGFEGFLKQSPQHPLARDAERAIAALR
jgi:TolA-binding protein